MSATPPQVLGGMNIEFELKLDLGAPEEVDVLVRALDLGAPVVARLRSTYFDTPDDRLARLGYALRIRQDGPRRIQTVKATGGAAMDPLARREWEQPVPGDAPVLAPDAPVSVALGKHVSELAARSEVRVIRSLWTVERPDALIEMVLDRGEVRSGEATAPFLEVELELKQGEPAALFALARRIGRLTPVRLGVLTKAQRAARLAHPPGKSDKWHGVALTEEMSAADAFRAIAHACLRQYRLNESRLLQEDNAAALHQARVALRRLRSAFHAFRPIIGGKPAKRLGTDLRWLTQQFGQARDIDVLLPRLHDRKAQALLQAARGPAYAAARFAIESALARELMIDLAEWLSTGKWAKRSDGGKQRDGPARDFGADAIRRLHDRLLEEGGAIVDGSDEDRHELRKTAKKLRYTVESFAALFDGGKVHKARVRYLAALEELQDHLGVLNDLAVMPDVLKGLGLRIGEARRLIGDGETRDLHLLQAADAMAAIRDARRFWE